MLLHAGERAQCRILIEACEDCIFISIVFLDDDDKERIGIEVDQLLHAEALSVGRQMVCTERAEHIARKCALSVGADLLAEELDDECARTFLQVSGVLPDKGDLARHLSNDLFCPLRARKDPSEIPDVLTLLRNGFVFCFARRGRGDVGMYAASRPKLRGAQYLWREGGRPADDEIGLHHENRLDIQIFEARIGDCLVCRAVLRADVFRVRHAHARNDAVTHAEREECFDRVLPDSNHALRRAFVQRSDRVALLIDILNRNGRIHRVCLLRQGRAPFVLMHANDGTARAEQERKDSEQYI